MGDRADGWLREHEQRHKLAQEALRGARQRVDALHSTQMIKAREMSAEVLRLRAEMTAMAAAHAEELKQAQEREVQWRRECTLMGRQLQRARKLARRVFHARNAAAAPPRARMGSQGTAATRFAYRLAKRGVAAVAAATAASSTPPPKASGPLHAVASVRKAMVTMSPVRRRRRAGKLALASTQSPQARNQEAPRPQQPSMQSTQSPPASMQASMGTYDWANDPPTPPLEGASAAVSSPSGTPPGSSINQLLAMGSTSPPVGGAASAGSSPGFRYVGAERDRARRQQLRGGDCARCAEWYGALRDGGHADLAREAVCRDCSRHRVRHTPPATPPGHWDVDFPLSETQGPVTPPQARE